MSSKKKSKKESKAKKAKKAEKVENERQSKLAYDLFDNPMTRNALKSMTPEQIERYKLIGTQMYGNIDFSKSEVLDNVPPPMTEALAYIKEGFKSGLQIEDLDEDEVFFLKDFYGDDWEKKIKNEYNMM
jgi:hypothetical protein